MIDTDCPGCRAETDAADDPQEGGVLTCTYCGYVGIWDYSYPGWRSPNPEEQAELMQNEQFLDSLNAGLAYRAWLERDADILRTVLHSKLDRVGLSSSDVAELCEEIMAAGYHTHPTEADFEYLGFGAGSGDPR